MEQQTAKPTEREKGVEKKSTLQRTPLLAGNWKMYKTVSESEALAKELKQLVAGVSGREILICPPSINLTKVSEIIMGTNICLGAQNLHWANEGAFTGELSGPMIKAAGCKYVIIGHSERRQYFGETDKIVNDKMNAALKAGLFPIVCVGETLEEREANNHFKVVERQIRDGVSNLVKEDYLKLVIAYEPVWAIGTGKTASPAQAQEMHAFIRKILSQIYNEPLAQKTRILYGGSVKPDNIDSLMSQPDIDGGLVGGASLKAADFSRIVAYQAA